MFSSLYQEIGDKARNVVTQQQEEIVEELVAIRDEIAKRCKEALEEDKWYLHLDHPLATLRTRRAQDKFCVQLREGLQSAGFVVDNVMLGVPAGKPQVAESQQFQRGMFRVRSTDNLFSQLPSHARDPAQEFTLPTPSRNSRAHVDIAPSDARTIGLQPPPPLYIATAFPENTDGIYQQEAAEPSVQQQLLISQQLPRTQMFQQPQWQRQEEAEQIRQLQQIRQQLLQHASLQRQELPPMPYPFTGRIRLPPIEISSNAIYAGSETRTEEPTASDAAVQVTAADVVMATPEETHMNTDDIDISDLQDVFEAAAEFAAPPAGPPPSPDNSMRTPAPSLLAESLPHAIVRIQLDLSHMRREAELPEKRVMGNVISLCSICQTEQPMCAFAPCGHMCCETCVAGCNGVCPFCRQHISTRTPLFES